VVVVEEEEVLEIEQQQQQEVLVAVVMEKLLQPLVMLVLQILVAVEALVETMLVVEVLEATAVPVSSSLLTQQHKRLCLYL
jgi:hypothetical protein